VKAPLLCVHNLTKTFPGCESPVIRDVSFCVYPGEVLTLVGPSGCGKTTTLRTIMGFEEADSGEVKRGEEVMQAVGVFVPPERRKVGFVFQDYALFPHLPVLENVMFGIRGVPKARRRAIATEVLWMLGLAGLEDRRPHDLSGGQQQRVALARAIAPGSRIVLLDEPFSSLDPDTRHTIRGEVRMLAERAKMAVVLVTHDQEEALSTADRLAVMRDGVIEQLGPPEFVYNHPANKFVAQFLGRTNLIQCHACGSLGETPLGKLELNREADGEVTLSLRPEHLAIHAPIDGRPSGKVVAREFKGHDMTYHVRIGSTEYLVQTDSDCRFKVGDTASLKPRTPAAIVDDSQAEPAKNIRLPLA
jgi:iron(III) transport system ATP-binding protein